MAGARDLNRLHEALDNDALRRGIDEVFELVEKIGHG